MEELSESLKKTLKQIDELLETMKSIGNNQRNNPLYLFYLFNYMTINSMRAVIKNMIDEIKKID
jgi:hypothetical protein